MQILLFAETENVANETDSTDGISNVARFQSLAATASSAASYRIALILSSEFEGCFKTAKERELVTLAVKRRLGAGNLSMQKLVQGVTSSTSEKDAERILKKYLELQGVLVEDVLMELKVLVGPDAYDDVCRLQIGLIGANAFHDGVLAKIAGIDSELREKITKVVASNDGNDDLGFVSSQIPELLSPTQKSFFEDCSSRAKRFRENEQDRIRQVKEAYLGKSLTELGFIDDEVLKASAAD